MVNFLWQGHLNYLTYIYKRRFNYSSSSYAFVQNILQRMSRKEIVLHHGCGSQRGGILAEWVSKQIGNIRSKNKKVQKVSTQNRLLSKSKRSTSNVRSTDIYSQPQVCQTRKINLTKNNSKSKWTGSMVKLKKDLGKNNGSSNDSYRQKSFRSSEIQQNKKAQRKTTQNIEDQIGLQDLHYQMVRLHQNVKKLHHQQ